MKSSIQAFLGNAPGKLPAAALAQKQGRDVLWASRPHRRQRWALIVAAWITAPILATIAASQPNSTWIHFVFALVLTMLVPLLIIMDWHETEFVLTTKSLLIKKGLFSSAIEEAQLRNVTGTSAQVSLLQRPLGLASLLIDVEIDEEQRRFSFHSITLDDALALREHLQRPSIQCEGPPPEAKNYPPT